MRLRHASRDRKGITLTEILISIMIMGVGIISLATLFPLGLLRIRSAQRQTRGAFLVESAIADMGARNLLAKPSFSLMTHKYGWFQTTTGPYDPWTQDTPYYGGDWVGTPHAGAFRISGQPGLPVAYDPLWRGVCSWGALLPGLYPAPTSASPPEARFGQGTGFSKSGMGFLRSDPNPMGFSSQPSAHGLQRISNLNGADTTIPAYYRTILETFVSPEDLVLQDPKGTYIDPNSGGQLQSPNPVVPDMSLSGYTTPTNDWRYSWFFTGQQSDVSQGTIFDGDIVVCENRAFGIDQTTDPFAATDTVYPVTGETVVEAVWGYSGSQTTTTTAWYAGPSARRTVLLRWPSTLPDPDVKVGSWIADVTYERATAETGRFSGVYPAQRCYWYQIAKRTEPTVDPGFAGDPSKPIYRQMTVWVTTPLRAQTPLTGAGTSTSPYHVEAALIMPSVINVYPRTVYTR